MVSIAPNLRVYMQLIVPKGGFAFSQYSLYKCQGIQQGMKARVLITGFFYSIRYNHHYYVGLSYEAASLYKKVPRFLSLKLLCQEKFLSHMQLLRHLWHVASYCRNTTCIPPLYLITLNIQVCSENTFPYINQKQRTVTSIFFTRHRQLLESDSVSVSAHFHNSVAAR